MKDGPLRRVIKCVARWKYAADVGTYRLVRRLRRQDHYRLGGDCRGCAKCCEAPSIRAGLLTWHLPPLRRLFLAWQEKVNGFVLERADNDRQVFVFRCTHFDPMTRKCDSYDSRPGMCRDYPRGLLDAVHPEFFPECGYRPVYRDAARLALAIDRRATLSPEQKAELKKKLFLDV
jgi:Fe-S-cluster containining protein